MICESGISIDIKYYTDVTYDIRLIGYINPVSSLFNFMIFDFIFKLRAFCLILYYHSLHAYAYSTLTLMILNDVYSLSYDHFLSWPSSFVNCFEFSSILFCSKNR